MLIHKLFFLALGEKFYCIQRCPHFRGHRIQRYVLISGSLLETYPESAVGE